MKEIIFNACALGEKELEFTCELADRFDGTIGEAFNVTEDYPLEMSSVLHGAKTIMVDELRSDLDIILGDKYEGDEWGLADKSKEVVLNTISTMCLSFERNMAKVVEHGEYDGLRIGDIQTIEKEATKCINDVISYSELLEEIEAFIDIDVKDYK